MIQSQLISGERYNLFQFETITAGNAANTKVKVAITNVKAAGSTAGTDYSTFNVVVRAYGDTDKKKNVLETFSNVNLDPNSPNYISRVIGDRKLTIDSTGKISESGDWVNNSSEYDINDFGKGQQDYGKCANGDVYGLTLSTEPMIQWYRTDIYKKLGLTPAKTWDEYYNNAKKVQASGAGGQIMGFGPNVSWWWMTLVWSFGGHLYDDNLNPTVNSKEAIAATDYLKKLLAVSPKGAITASGDDVTSRFLGENIGAMLNYSGYYGMALDPKINKNQGNIGTAPMPMGAADITHLAGWNIGIPSDAKNPDAAWKFLEFVLGKTNSKAYLESGAAAIGRQSIINNAELVAKNPYLPQLNISASSRVERYPQIAVWPEFETAAIEAVTQVLTGKQSSQAAMTALNEKLKPILAKEPRG